MAFQSHTVNQLDIFSNCCLYIYIYVCMCVCALEMPGACGLRPCARTHFKKGLVSYSSGLGDGEQIPSYYVATGNPMTFKC